MTKRYTIAVDFDAVIHKYTGWDGDVPTGMPIEGAKEGCQELAKDYDVVVFTTRKPALVLQWLKDYGMDGIFKDVTNEKRPFLVIIDDRTIRFRGTWEGLPKRVREFKTYWEKNEEKPTL